MIWHSKLDANLLQKTLYKGFVLEFCAVSLLLLGAIFLPTHWLNLVGLLLCIFSFLLIAWGTLPYRHLQKLEKNPHRLVLEENTLNFFVYGTLKNSFSISSIKSLSFRSGPHFGIFLHLVEGKDFFLPYFSKRSFLELEDFLNLSLN